MAISFVDEPKSFTLEVKHTHWKDAIEKEISAFEDNHTWTLQTLPPGKWAINYKFVYIIKYKPEVSI